MADESLILVFIPALAPLLVRAEDLKGGPFTETEVLRIRDHANCVAMPSAPTAAVEAERGYRDLKPEDCWVEWKRLRVELGRAEPNGTVEGMIGHFGFMLTVAAPPLSQRRSKLVIASRRS